MSYNPFEDVSIDNPLPCKEVEGTYTRGEDVSESNPWPVMVVDADAYTKFADVSEANPQPIALDTGSTYTRFEDLSDTNRKPVVIVEGQSYDPKQPISMTNPWPVIDTGGGGGGGYTGPLDLVPGAVVAYGQRALSAAKLGTALYTIRRDSDSTTQSFNSDAVTGAAPAASIATFIGGPFTHSGAVTDTMDTIVLTDAFTDVAVGQPITGTDIQAGTIVIDISLLPTIQISLPATGTNASETLTFTPLGYYPLINDQSSNAFNATQATADSQMQYKVISDNSFPAYGSRYGVGTAQTADVVSRSEGNALTAFCIAKMTATDSQSKAFFFIANADESVGYGLTASVGNVYFFAYTDDLYAEMDIDGSDFAGLHIYELTIAPDGTVHIYIDGVDQTLIDNGDNPPYPLTEIVNGHIVISSAYPIGMLSNSGQQEDLIYGGATILSGPDRLAIRQNIADYYGITLG